MMAKKIFRWTHLILAISISLYLFIASFTGAILGLYEGSVNYSKANNTEKNVTLSELYGKLTEKYPEISLLEKTDEGLKLEALDADSNELSGYISPHSGTLIQNKKAEKNTIIDSVTALHRSLYMENTGRFLVGLGSVLFALLLISGFFLMLKSYPKISHFWTQWKYTNWAQTYHHTLGRITLLPLLVLAITGAFLFVLRFEIGLKEKAGQIQKKNISQNHTPVSPQEFPLFKTTSIQEVKRLEVPFDDSENFILENAQGKYELDYHSGQEISFVPNSDLAQWKDLSYQIHTGKINPIVAWVLALASLSVIGFIISGFYLFWKKSKKISLETVSAEKAEWAVWYGSENGNTRTFAYHIAEQLLHQGKKTHICSLNDAKAFPSLKKLIICTSTYGNGEAPSNADTFQKKTASLNSLSAEYCILGFGSKEYDDFCGFAKRISEAFQVVASAKAMVPLQCIDRNKKEEIENALEKINTAWGINLDDMPNDISLPNEHFEDFTVESIAPISTQNQYIRIRISALSSAEAVSGDLIKIQIPSTEDYRYYSVAKWQDQIELWVKVLKDGQCSPHLASQKVGNSLSAMIDPHPHFYFPKDASRVVMISNGTGIAPFLGMIREEKTARIELFAGFRFRDALVAELEQEVFGYTQENKNLKIHWSYSQAEKQQRITSLFSEHLSRIISEIEQGAVLMICGSLDLKKEVEAMISAQFQQTPSSQNIELWYKEKKLLCDCY